ncbi:hypothetical protein D3C76_1469180 [compost metagenome]
MTRRRQLIQRLTVKAAVNGRFGNAIAIDDAELSTESFLQQSVIGDTASIRAGNQQLHGANVQPFFINMLHERQDERRRRFEYRNVLVPNPAV